MKTQFFFKIPLIGSWENNFSRYLFDVKQNIHMNLRVLLWIAFLLIGRIAMGVEFKAKSGDTFILRLPLSVMPKEIDPHLGNDIPLNKICRQIFDNLVELDESAAPLPRLADKWKISAADNTITFTLSKNATFHTGQAITAEDVKQSFIRSSRKGNLVAQQISDFNTCITIGTCSGFKILGPRDFSIKLIDANFEDFFKRVASMDASIVLERNRKLIGSGPYKIKKLSKDTLALEPAKTPSSGKLLFKEILFSLVGRDQAVEKFKKGLIDEFDNIQYSYTPGSIPDSHEIVITLPATAMMVLNLKSGPFKNLELRKFLRDQLDVTKFLDSLNVEGVPAGSLIPKGMLGHIPLDNFKNKNTGAPKLRGLVRIGVVTKFSQTAAIRSYLPELLGRAGLTTIIIEKSFNELLKDFRRQELDLIIKADAPKYRDEISMFDSLLSGSNSNISSFRNSDLDRLSSASLPRELLGDRLSRIKKMEDIVRRELPVIPIYYPILKVRVSRQLLLRGISVRSNFLWDMRY